MNIHVYRPSSGFHAKNNAKNNSKGKNVIWMMKQPFYAGNSK